MLNIKWPWTKKPKRKEVEEIEGDGVEEQIEEEEDSEIEGERGLPSVNKSRSIQGRVVRLAIMGCTITIILLLLGRYYAGLYDKRQSEKPTAAEAAGKVEENKPGTTMPFPMLPPPEALPPEAANPGVQIGKDGKASAPATPVPALVSYGNEGAGSGMTAAGKPIKSPEELEREARLNSPLKKGGAVSLPGAVRGVSFNAETGGGLGFKADALQGMNTPSTQATILADRNLMVAKGAFMDCTLDTEMDSSLAGMASCTLARDIYGDNGRVILLEKGTVCTGEYRGDMKPGQVRLFVLWTRAKTPRGVIVDLSSIGTDRLGRTGVEGYVDNHFWDRFGAAIMMTVIQQAATTLQNRASRGGQINQTNQASPLVSDTQSLALEMVKPTADLPATLHKHRGERVSIYLARDLDFRAVYSLDKADYDK